MIRQWLERKVAVPYDRSRVGSRSRRRMPHPTTGAARHRGRVDEAVRHRGHAGEAAHHRAARHGAVGARTSGGASCSLAEYSDHSWAT